MKPIQIHDSTFYNGDCISGATENIKDDSVDLIITDPPYGINGDKLHKHYNRKEEFVIDGYVEIPQSEYSDFSTQWIKEAERVLKPGGSIYIVSGYTNLIDILNALKKTNLKEINHIIWKYNFGVFTTQKYISSHYHILFYEKPGSKRTFNLESRFGLSEKTETDRSCNNADREDVWIINREYKPGQVKNKNELPTKLLIKMIQYSSNEGDLVCDFFLGGFSTAKAAISLNRVATGFEISKSMFDMKIEEMREITPGYLIPTLRRPIIEEIENQGKTWTDEEIQKLSDCYFNLVTLNKPKKEIKELLCNEFGRGRWAIEKALKKLDLPALKRPKQMKKKPVENLSKFLK
ncbi:MAG: site-specific DNA-methyltransferase [Methanoregula sp.]|jgi:site-specific DNA-methyltransferase (adenine-specific)|uniref:DNA-methyltransferase n=1 Tax=Methanoregula sp. TaxID=2052170 RepID=UPI003C270526